MNNKLFRIMALLVASAYLTACGTVSGWLEDDVYEAPPAELIDITAEFDAEVVWSTDTGAGASDDYSDLAAWIEGERIIAVDHEGEVSSHALQTGQRLWQVDLDIPVISGAGGGDGLILIGSQEGGVYALDETNGKLRWQHQLSSEVLAPPKAAQGVVVARTADGRITGLSAEDGSVLWNYQRAVPLLSLRGASAPVIIDDTIIAGYANGKLVALAVSNGSVLWEKSVAIPRGRTELDRIVDIDSDPVVKNDVVYVVAFNGRLAAVDLYSGKILWARELSSRSGLDVAPGETVYVTDDVDHIWSIQDGSGDGLWRQTRLIRRKATAPVIVGDYLLVGDFEGYVHWLSRQDGHFVNRIRVAKSAIRSKPVVKGDLVFVTASDGTLTALKVN